LVEINAYSYVDRRRFVQFLIILVAAGVRKWRYIIEVKPQDIFELKEKEGKSDNLILGYGSF